MSYVLCCSPSMTPFLSGSHGIETCSFVHSYPCGGGSPAPSHANSRALCTLGQSFLSQSVSPDSFHSLYALMTHPIWPSAHALNFHCGSPKGSRVRNVIYPFGSVLWRKSVSRMDRSSCGNR